MRHWPDGNERVDRRMRFRLGSGILAAHVVVATGVAFASPQLRVAPATVRPGEPVLVTVSAATDPPHGTAAGKQLHFFRAKDGYQAVFAVPLDAKPERISIKVDGVTDPAIVAVRFRAYTETDVVVEDELANPPAELRGQIDADNAAILEALREDEGEPQFTRAFLHPRGKTTSPFGEWRTFNDGHRSQHLGLDVRAREGARVSAINTGTVTLVRDTYLAGKVVVVAHGGGIASTYFHLSATAVAEGDRVARGDEIGRAGHTGRTTGPHIHLGVRVHGGFVDPASFFRLPIAVATPATARR